MVVVIPKEPDDFASPSLLSRSTVMCKLQSRLYHVVPRSGTNISSELLEVMLVSFDRKIKVKIYRQYCWQHEISIYTLHSSDGGFQVPSVQGYELPTLIFIVSYEWVGGAAHCEKRKLSPSYCKAVSYPV